MEEETDRSFYQPIIDSEIINLRKVIVDIIFEIGDKMKQRNHTL